MLGSQACTTTPGTHILFKRAHVLEHTHAGHIHLLSFSGVSYSFTAAPTSDQGLGERRVWPPRAPPSCRLPRDPALPSLQRLPGPELGWQTLGAAPGGGCPGGAGAGLSPPRPAGVRVRRPRIRDVALGARSPAPSHLRSPFSEPAGSGARKPRRSELGLTRGLGPEAGWAGWPGAPPRCTALKPSRRQASVPEGSCCLSRKLHLQTSARPGEDLGSPEEPPGPARPAPPRPARAAPPQEIPQREEHGDFLLEPPGSGLLRRCLPSGSSLASCSSWRVWRCPLCALSSGPCLLGTSHRRWKWCPSRRCGAEATAGRWRGWWTSPRSTRARWSTYSARPASPCRAAPAAVATRTCTACPWRRPTSPCRS